MGKGRDKRKKKEDPSKAAKRAAKQANKLQKGSKKEGEGEGPQGFNNEESIEVTLKRLQKAQMKLRTTEEVANVPPPTPRANVVLTEHPERDNELIIFGGEFWNGEVTEAYNDMYFYNTKRNSWAKLSSAVNPAPRSSSQGLIYKHYLIVYGGEFVSQSQSQYLHFKDVWRYDSRASEWEELKSLKGGPPSRSGHRMVLHKRTAVMFGGFYDNAQECRYFNDLWVLSNLDGAGHWAEIKTAPAGEAPHARSGHNMAVYNDTVFVYGGYSTAKFNRFKKSEATVHHDLWMLPLTTGGQSTAATTDSHLLPMWTKIRLGGVPPPIRCGVASASREKKMYLFGGVVDIESPGGKLISTFNNDLFVFHMDTKRFYPVVLHGKSQSNTGKKDGDKSNLNDLEAQLSALNLKKGSESAGEDTVSNDDSSSDSGSNSSDDDEDDNGEAAAVMVNSREMKESFETRKNGQVYPHRRMDASMVVMGNFLYIYGGQFESGKKEITMSDLFALNLNKLDTYSVLLSQDLSAAVWMGKETESNARSWETGSTVVSAVFDMDYDDDDDEEDEDVEGGVGVNFARMPREVVLNARDDAEEAPDAIPAELDMDVTPGLDEMVSGITRGQKKGLKVHKEQLLAQLGASAAVPTPQHEESFNSFFERTQEFWMTTARDSYEGKRTDRKVRKEAAEFARRRYHEARELLSQLKLIEEQEQEEARFFRERKLQKDLEWEKYQREQEEEEEQEEADGEQDAEESAE